MPQSVSGHGEDTMKTLATIPVLRIFDLDTALDFYREYLGFTVDWEHRFEPELPVYLQVSKGDLVLHLSEHHGSGTPGSVVYVRVEGVQEFHRELGQKSYSRLRPGVERTPWGSLCMELLDPFGNRLKLDEALEEEG
jgi:catechol 2,3-dioxygenase-like lactoylglutathione lyase family enzyme